jgi:uncharacterized integral membrane protein (TIGR00698 family)
MGDERKGIFDFIPGIIFCVVIAVFSFGVWYLWKPISCLMWSFIYSILIANIIKIPESMKAGINFVSSTLLKGTIATLGLVTSAVIWFQVGIGVVNVLVVISFSFFFGLWLGRRMGLSDRLSTLIGVGTSICGASAIAAMAPAIEAREEEIGLAIAGITLFGLISMFLYPFLFLNTQIYDWLLQNINVYAVWVGSGVHETAQVIVAASALGQDVIRPAMLIKSVRIFMIGPVVLLATFIFNKFEDDTTEKKTKLVVPLFGIIFIVNSVITSILDAHLTGVALYGWQSFKLEMGGKILPFLLAIGFAGVGSKVRFKNIAKLGAKPFAVAALMAILAGILSLCLAVLVAPMIPY